MKCGIVELLRISPRRFVTATTHVACMSCKELESYLSLSDRLALGMLLPQAHGLGLHHVFILLLILYLVVKAGVGSGRDLVCVVAGLEQVALVSVVLIVQRKSSSSSCLILHTYLTCESKVLLGVRSGLRRLWQTVSFNCGTLFFLVVMSGRLCLP